jgi:hypothetical protein
LIESGSGALIVTLYACEPDAGVDALSVAVTVKV